MIRKWFGIAALIVTAITLLNLSSCARGRKLTSITIQPAGGTFATVDPSLNFQFKAVGTYIHPPSTLDITNQVTWQSDNPQVIQVTSAGVVSPNTACGIAQVFAQMHDSGNDVISNSASLTVDGPASLGCPQGGTTNNLSVSVTGGANGVISSSPAGINCGTTCAAPFATGTTVNLTATPNSGHSFGGWGGCDSQSGDSCTVLVNIDRAVTATFN